MFSFDWKWRVWDDCFSKYHSPNWWEDTLEGTNKLKISYCQELTDAKVLWEDMAVNYKEYFSKLPDKDVMLPQRKIFELIDYSKNKDIYLSLFILCGIKK